MCLRLYTLFRSLLSHKYVREFLVQDVLHLHERYPAVLLCGKQAQHCRLVLFQDSDFAGDLEDSKSTSRGVLCTFGSRTFVPVSGMCKKQTSVSHSSTESEVNFLDAGLRVDELLALDLWDIVIENLPSIKDNVNLNILASRKLVRLLIQNQDPTCHKKMEGWRIEWGGSRTHQHTFFSKRVSAVHFFECNETVIKMIKKERRPTMRRMSRTHRIAFDSLFDRINVAPKIRIKYVDTNNQLADILTEKKASQEMKKIIFSVGSHNKFFDVLSCSHFNNFLSDPIGKQELHVKERSRNDFERRLSGGESETIVYWRAIRGVRKSPKKLVRPDSGTEVGYSQMNRQENVPVASRKLVREDQLQTDSDERKLSNSNSTRKFAVSSPELRRDTWNARTINTWARFFSSCRWDWECQQATQHSQCMHTKQMCGYGDWSWLRRWKPPSTLARIIYRIRGSTRTQNSRRLKVCSTTLKSW